jgi:hypothetical protein
MGFFSALRRRVIRVIGLARFFYAQRIKGFDPPTVPHLDDETAQWLEEQLKGTKLYLEFGSGGSTLLANRLGVRTVSVESDRFYAASVRHALANPELIEILTPAVGITREWGFPVFFKRRKGRRYVTAPFHRFDSQFPDLIMVDGRYRVACALESARQASRAGAESRLLLDDYAQRPEYRVLEQYLGAPVRIGRAAMFTLGRHEIAQSLIREYSTDPR